MIIIIGIAGSGKSVQSELLSKALNCVWVGTGKLLRESMDKEVQKRMLSGQLLDDSITIGVLKTEFEKFDAKNNEFVMDGSPRTIVQAKWFVDEIEAGNLKMTALIHLVASEKTAEDRLIHRGRADDVHDAIVERFSEYKNVIKPIIDFFKEHGIEAHDINGEQPVEVVHQQILNIINQ